MEVGHHLAVRHILLRTVAHVPNRRSAPRQFVVTNHFTELRLQ